MATGSMSAAATQPARIAQDRQAILRRSTLAPMITATAMIASHANRAGGEDSAYEPSPSGSHHQGPPSIPGIRVSRSSAHEYLSTAMADAGTCGWIVEVRREMATKTKPATTIIA